MSAPRTPPTTRTIPRANARQCECIAYSFRSWMSCNPTLVEKLHHLLPALTEVQGMPLIVLDGELPPFPSGFMHVLHQAHAVSLQCVSRRRGVVCLPIEVEVVALLHEGDRGVLLVDEFEVKELTPSPDTGVKVLVLELERQSHLRGVEAYGCSEIRRPLLEIIVSSAEAPGRSPPRRGCAPRWQEPPPEERGRATCRTISPSVGRAFPIPECPRRAGTAPARRRGCRC